MKCEECGSLLKLRENESENKDFELYQCDNYCSFYYIDKENRIIDCMIIIKEDFLFDLKINSGRENQLIIRRGLKPIYKMKIEELKIEEFERFAGNIIKILIFT